MPDSRFIGGADEFRPAPAAPAGGDIPAAALDAVAEVLAADPGGDGKPSKEAKAQAVKIIKALKSGELDDLGGGDAPSD